MGKKRTKTGSEPQKRDRIAHWYLQCPLCYGGDGGLGSQYGRQGDSGSPAQVIYYRCERCGHTWQIERRQLEGPRQTNMSPPRVQHRDVQLNARDSDGMTRRSAQGG